MRSLWRVLCWILEALAWALALGSAAAAVGANGGRWSHRLDLLTHPIMLWFAAAAAAFVLSWFALSLWRGWAIRALAIVAMAAAGAVMAPDFTRPMAYAPANAPHQIKLIEFNIWNEHSDPEAIARWIANQDPDIVVIEEPTEATATKLQSIAGLYTVHRDGAIVATRRKPVMSRVAWDFHKLPGQAFFLNVPSIYGFDGQPFDLIAAHMGWPIPARHRAAEDLHENLILDQMDRDRVILTGDFNSTQWSFRQRRSDSTLGLERRDRALATWPARIPQLHGRNFPLPFMPIDHVYAGSLWRTVKVERGPRMGSDHYPLIATLAWAGPVGGDPKLWPNAR